MRLLLDTHAFILWDNATIPARVRQRIVEADEVFVSASSAWEIAIKSALGKLDARSSLAPALADYGFSSLVITLEHADAVRRLPRIHRDPFDRMLVAQALVEKLVIVTRDAAVRAYDVPTVWTDASRTT